MVGRFSLALPEISELLVKLCDDDRLAGGGDDHLHVGLALPHLPGGLLAGAGRLKYFQILRLLIILLYLLPLLDWK